MRLRAREFAVNGLLFVVVPGSLGNSHVGEGFFTAFNDAAIGMCNKGEIDASLLADCMFPIYCPDADVSKFLPMCVSAMPQHIFKQSFNKLLIRVYSCTLEAAKRVP